MGALVTSNEAGDSVPDWPLAYGRMVPVGHLQGPVVYEYLHRVVAGSVAILTMVLAGWAFIHEKGTAVRIISAAAVAGIIGQALLGGVRVRLGESHSYGIATLHAFTAQAFLCILTVLVVQVSPQWRSGGLMRGGGGTSRGLAAACTAAAAVLLLQTLLGAGYRHRILGLAPHAAGAVVVTCLAIGVWVAARRASQGAPLESPARGVHALARLALLSVAAQIVLGPVTYLLLQQTRSGPSAAGMSPVVPVVVVLAVLHLGVGSALLVETMVLSLWTLSASRSAQNPPGTSAT
jgi:cytochrome c oxidase assembly protein subunit 15